MAGITESSRVFSSPCRSHASLASMLRTLMMLQVTGGALMGWAVLSLTHPDATVGLRATGAVALGVLTPALAVICGSLICAVWAGLRPWSLTHWRVLINETALALRLFLWRQPWSGAPTPRLDGPEDGPPVLLVHGYFCNHRIWDELTHDLVAAGYRVARIDLEPVFASIDDYVPLIDNAVRVLRAQNATRAIALVGHSMGGLALRAWLRQHGNARVACLLTLGTPHAGTRLAHLTQTHNGRQMKHGSAWLQQLHADETPATQALVHVALSAHDTIVFPQTVQTLPQASLTRLDGLGHLQLCQHPRVRSWVLDRLSTCLK